MDLSVIIPAADDVRIKDCVESIDEDVEILVSLNGPTNDVSEIVERLGVRTCYLKDRNLGAALDEGILRSTKGNVLLMDSDCTFENNCIKILYENLADSKLSKGRVVYRRNDRVASVIADFREFLTEGPNAFKPPLAMRKSIVEDVGYYFDRDIHWVEDSDLNNRVLRKGLKVNYSPDAVVYHPSLTIPVDLRSAFRYGVGKRIGVDKGIMTGVGTHFPLLLKMTRERGILPAAYSVLWNLFYSTGFFYQGFFDVYGVRKDR